MNTTHLKHELQFVVFTLAQEEFGIDIMRVREIKKLPRVTRLPNAAEYIDGVINLRGEVLPVIDLRSRFGMQRREATEETRVIIVELDRGKVGLVVDGVTEVLRTETAALQDPPDLLSVDTRFIEAVGNIDERLLLILRVDTLLDSADTRLSESIHQVTEDNHELAPVAGDGRV